MDLKEYTLDELLPYEQPTKYIVESTKYDDSYKTPVLTAGKSFILGYTNETEGIFEKDRLPVIIFDDFTTASQYVNFPFKVKSSAMKILNVNTDLVLPKYIYYLMQTIQIEHDTHKRYWIQHFSKIKVTIPSLEIQEKIVERLDEMNSQIDEGITTLKKTDSLLNVYRDAVLDDAFKGDYKKVPLAEISEAISGYAFKSSNYTDSGKYVVIKIGNVKEQFFDFGRDLTRTNEVDEKILAKYLLQEGDCVITLTGSRGKRDYGFVSMVTNQDNYLLNQRVAALRFERTKAIPKFYQYYLMSNEYRNAFFSYETGNVGQGNVGIKALSEPLVVLPTIEEQEKIVALIESKLSVCKSIEQTIKNTLVEAEALRQSALKKAFEGGLA